MNRVQQARNSLEQFAQQKDPVGNPRVQGHSIDLSPFDMDKLNSPVVMRDPQAKKLRQDEIKAAQNAVIQGGTSWQVVLVARKLYETVGQKYAFSSYAKNQHAQCSRAVLKLIIQVLRSAVAGSQPQCSDTVLNIMDVVLRCYTSFSPGVSTFRDESLMLFQQCTQYPRALALHFGRWTAGTHVDGGVGERPYTQDQQNLLIRGFTNLKGPKLKLFLQHTVDIKKRGASDERMTSVINALAGEGWSIKC